MLCLALLAMHEPRRGMSEATRVGDARRPGSPYLLVLGIPTMWWIIASGALHNFNMYALGSFLPAFLIRYHHVTVQTAGFIAGIVVGSVGALGMLLGGRLGDAMVRRRANGRMLVACAALTLSVPCVFFALNRPPGALSSFMLLQGAATMLMYAYYSAVYPTMHDILEPSLRGTGMALYFFAMYALGASLGPLATGWISDFFARRAALAAHVTPLAQQTIPDTFRAAGLHQAMYVIPILGIILAAILLAGSLTVGKDMQKLKSWMEGV